MSQRNGRLNSLADVAEVPIPVVPLTQRAPDELPSLVTRPTDQASDQARSSKIQKQPSVVISGHLKILAEQKYKPKAEKIPHLIRLDPWLDDLLRKQVLTLQMNGHRKLTKEAVVTAALMALLGVQEPPTD